VVDNARTTPDLNRSMHASYRSPYAPLEGTVRSPRALFIDRWGTLLHTPEGGHAREPSEVRFLDGALEAMFRASRAGWSLYLLGNEEALAYGKLAREAWEAVQKKILDDLARAGVAIGGCYACLEHPEGIAGQQNDSVYLLPNTGAFYHATHRHGVDLSRSWVIGDSSLELVAGWRAGCRLAAVRTGQGLLDGTYEVAPQVHENDLQAVLQELLTRTGAVHH
jgi:HAD superfamily hydrolase (TIGR01662 family)